MKDDFLDSLRRGNRNTAAKIFPEDESHPEKRRPFLPWFVIAAVAIFFYGLGSWTHTSDIPDHRAETAPTEIVPAETVTVTVTVTKEVTVTKTVPAMPKDCTDALQIAIDLEKYTPTIINEGGRATDILKEARIAIVEKDHQKLNALGTRVNNMTNEASAATSNLQQLQDRLVAKLADCNHVLGR